MKNLLRAFAPLMAITAAYDGLYERNYPVKVASPQSKESIIAYKKAAEEKRKRKAEKRRKKNNEFDR